AARDDDGSSRQQPGEGSNAASHASSPIVDLPRSESWQAGRNAERVGDRDTRTRNVEPGLRDSQLWRRRYGALTARRKRGSWAMSLKNQPASSRIDAARLGLAPT